MAMSEGRRLAGLAALPVALTACSPVPQAVDRSTCAAEAVLLAEATPLRSGPSDRAGVLRTLAAGQPIYLCGEQGGFRSILLPRPGARANCQSDASAACDTGWLPRDAATLLAG
jgi:hypothetical protein